MSTLMTFVGRKAWRLTGLALTLAAICGTAQAGACPPKAVPEMDPGSILSAITLLSGGVMILTDRRRTK